jgi:hypothetical protein
MKLTTALLLVVAVLAMTACGGDKTMTSTSKPPASISLRKAPSYNTAAQTCAAVPPQTLARDLGLSTTDHATIARKYAERNTPLALRQGAYEGCLAGLSK